MTRHSTAGRRRRWGRGALLLVGGAAWFVMACGGLSMNVRFEGFPEVVKSTKGDDCRLFRRSPRVHIMRISVAGEQSGAPQEVDGTSVDIAVENRTRMAELARQNLTLPPGPFELELQGQAQTGDVLQVTVSYPSGSSTAEETARCTVN